MIRLPWLGENIPMAFQRLTDDGLVATETGSDIMSGRWMYVDNFQGLVNEGTSYYRDLLEQ